MPHLICFIASHVTTKRLPFIKELLQSINTQTELCRIYLSWSSDTECKSTISIILEETKSVTSIYSESKLSQFEHYRRLLKIESPPQKDTYLMFSDDDGLRLEYR